MLKKMKSKKNIPLLQSFKCAIKGVVSCFKSERNFRIHLCALFYVVWFSRFYNFSKVEISVICLTVGFVITAELLNTAIETVVDLVSPEKNTLAGLSKDIAAGGVLISAITAVAVGIVMFLDKKILQKILKFYIDNPLNVVILAATIILWLLLILLPNIINNKKDD